MSVILFSGGRGNRTLLESISANNEIIFPKLKVIVNGLDDGASTGAIRKLFDNRMHGISDFLKVAIAMSPNVHLKVVLEQRLPVIKTTKDQLKFSKDLHEFLLLSGDFIVSESIDLSESVKEELKKHIFNFVDYLYQKTRSIVNLSDFKIGNIVFASMYINSNLNFHNALLNFQEFCQVDRKAFDIIQSSEHNSYLVGVLKSGPLLPNEAAVVLTRTSDIIEETFQIRNPLTAEDIRNICSKEFVDKLTDLQQTQFIPSANIEVLEAIKNSDAIIYGAGTPYSSLLPSLELGGMADAIKNVNCKKILVVNLSKETSNTLFVTDLLDSLMKYLSKSLGDTAVFHPQDYITHIIVPDDVEQNELDGVIKLDENEIKERYQWVDIIRSDIRDSVNISKHDGTKLKHCLIDVIKHE